MMLRLFVVVAALAASVGCKVESKGSTKSTSNHFSYDFDDNGCKTGLHAASTVAELCTKLADHTLNKGCAMGMRSTMYRQHDCFTVLGSKPSAAGSSDGPVTTNDNLGGTNFYRYEMNHLGCQTGEHVFVGKKEYCAGLMNEALNNNCAHDSRKLMFELNGCE